MRYLGIDFGTKRVGVAVSDESNRLAFPKAVFSNDRNLIAALSVIVHENNITHIVIGESRDYHGEENPIMRKVNDFVGRFKDAIPTVAIIFELEFLTSAEAARLQGSIEKLDASAAALILKNYLERTNQLSRDRKEEPVISSVISYDDFKKVEIRIGEVLSADRVPETDKLLQLSVDFNEDKLRHVVSGIARFFPDPTVLIGRKFPFVTNLESRTIRGLESQAMILAVSEGETFSLFEVGKGVPTGSVVK